MCIAFFFSILALMFQLYLLPLLFLSFFSLSNFRYALNFCLHNITFITIVTIQTSEVYVNRSKFICKYVKDFSQKPRLKSTQQQGFYRNKQTQYNRKCSLSTTHTWLRQIFIQFTCHIIVTALAEFFRIPTCSRFCTNCRHTS